VSDDSLYPQLMDIMGYMITSARGLLDEPQAYGPLRLAEGVSRLCESLAAQYPADAAFLTALKERIDASKFDVMFDPAAFTAMLDDAVLRYTIRLKQGW
jgi:hypothetical protein